MAITNQIAATTEEAASQVGSDAGRQSMVRAAFEGFAGGAHPCVGARSVVRRGTYDLRLYGEMGTASDVDALAGDIAAFSAAVVPGEWSSFVAVFDGPLHLDEDSFTALLWRQLQLLHDADRTRHAWDPRVSSDPASPSFSFSVGGAAFFVIGLHAEASRWARRFPWPTLVFNPHEQFVELRAADRYDRMSAVIRARDAELQGSSNPSLSDFGTRSEARQYSGQELPDTWRCPLHVRDRE